MMLPVFLTLLGVMCLSSAHGLGELKTMELDYGERTGAKLDPVIDYFGTNKYYIPGFAAKWIEAVTYCAKVGGMLTDVQSPAEMNFLHKLSAKTSSKYGLWVGAGAVGQNKTFIWISNPTQVVNEFWRKNEPKLKNGNCAAFVWVMVDIPGLEVNPCDQSMRRFICKLPASN